MKRNVIFIVIWFLTALATCGTRQIGKDYYTFKEFKCNSCELKLNGCYVNDYLSKDPIYFAGKTQDSMRSNIICLYKEGVYLNLGSQSRNRTQIDTLLKVISELKDSSLYYSGQCWGNFTIRKDSIFIQSLYYNFVLPKLGYYSILEWRGIIESDTSFRLVCHFDYQANIYVRENKLYRYMSNPYKPNHANWIMDNKHLNKLYNKGKIGNKALWESIR